MRELYTKGLIDNKGTCNPFRGCEHGCIYCDARSKVYGIEGDFSNILVKINAIDLARKELSKKRKKIMVVTGSMCDPYTISESKIKYTRRILEIIEEYGHGVSILTKNELALRDIDLFMKIKKKNTVIIQYTITTLDDNLGKIIEPYASLPTRRLNALKQFANAGFTIGVWMTPILPFITDTEDNIKQIVKSCHEVGVKFIVCFAIGTTMREGSREYFYKNLDLQFPGLKEKYIKTYKNNYSCPSLNNDHLFTIFKEECNKYGILYDFNTIIEVFFVAKQVIEN